MVKKNDDYKFLFGPVPSRRLGLSLGVDIVPYKVCSLDCVYCESGKTTDLTIKRSPLVSVAEVINELDLYLSSGPALDYITFSGNGEPTLNSDISVVVNHLKKNYPEYKIALLTNSTLFFMESVRNEVKEVDLVVASIDAVSPEVFRSINRPEKTLNMKNIIDGLVQFRKIFKKKLWIEIFIVPGENGNEAEIPLIDEAIKKIRPEKIQLNTLDRPGTEDWVGVADKMCMEKFIKGLTSAEIIGNCDSNNVGHKVSDGINSKIINLVTRRPCTIRDISVSLGLSVEDVDEYLCQLVGKGLIIRRIMNRGTFYLVPD